MPISVPGQVVVRVFAKCLPLIACSMLLLPPTA